MDKVSLSDKMVEIIGAIQTGVVKASDFAMEQIPDIAMQYVLYGRVVTSVTSGLLLLCGIVCFGAMIWAYRNPWNASTFSFERNRKRSDSNEFVMVLGGVFGTISTISAFATFDYLVWFAPKVWLLKQLATMLK